MGREQFLTEMVGQHPQVERVAVGEFADKRCQCDGINTATKAYYAKQGDRLALRLSGGGRRSSPGCWGALARFHIGVPLLVSDLDATQAAAD